MHLIVLTAVQHTAFAASLDLRGEEKRLHDAILIAVKAPTTADDIVVTFSPTTVVVSVKVKDADSAFGVLAPVFCSSPYCATGNIVIKYGEEENASTRTVNLARASASLIAHSDELPYN